MKPTASLIILLVILVITFGSSRSRGNPFGVITMEAKKTSSAEAEAVEVTKIVDPIAVGQGNGQILLLSEKESDSQNLFVEVHASISIMVSKMAATSLDSRNVNFS